MDQYELIRTAQRVYGKSIRQIARETGHHRETIRKALAGLEPQYRRRKEVPFPVMGSVAAIVEKWLRTDQEQPKKQRHTARRVYTRLVEEYGFGGAESTVRRWVRECKARLGYGAQQAVLPLDPEAAREAEVDWGTAWVKMEGALRRVKLFCMRSRFSGKSFVRAYPWERQEMFFDGHLHAFAYYGGVFPVQVMDNLSLAVRRILRGKKRIEQERFVAFRSYYTFQVRFCTPGEGREKGGVETLVGFARRNFLVPIPEVRDFEELNELLLRRCHAHSQGKVQGRGGPAHHRRATPRGTGASCGPSRAPL
ncbi:IS21 family transposase [Acidobacteria bacterium AH-259-O06]|nr:IS21 family transposase [Acidobacteria bacterium AH-259-O06]